MTNGLGLKSSKQIKVKETTGRNVDDDYDNFLTQLADIIIDSYISMTPKQRKECQVKNKKNLQTKK